MADGISLSLSLEHRNGILMNVNAASLNLRTLVAVHEPSTARIGRRNLKLANFPDG